MLKNRGTDRLWCKSAHREPPLLLWDNLLAVSGVAARGRVWQPSGAGSINDPPQQIERQRPEAQPE